MGVAFPLAPRARSLGVGLDLPWAGEVGLEVGADGREGPTERVARFFEGHAAPFGHAFVSLQARDRSVPRLEDYVEAWDALFSRVPQITRALHHTALSVGSLVPVDRRATLALTAALSERYDLAWVNEDVGLWSLDGRPLPYPLPPVLDARALAPAVRAVRECQRALPVPFVIEFPGFSESASVTLGAMHAYDFFRVLAEEAEAPVTLDVGHLLSYQWLRGRRGDALFDELERLPLAHAFELHLAGSSIVDGAFVDAHHGALLEAQIELAARLAARCPNLRAITFEDPAIDASGALDAVSATSFAALSRRMARWLAEPESSAPSPPPPPPSRARTPEIDLAPLERALAADVLGHARASLDPTLSALLEPAHGSIASLRALCVARTFARVHRGVGRLEDRFPTAFAAWRAHHPDDASLALLAEAFFAAPETAAFREGLAETDGACIEEVFADFADRVGLGDAVAREEERARAIIRALAITPRPGFRVPSFVRTREHGFAIVVRGDAPTLHAASRGRYVRGPITRLVADLIEGARQGDVAARHGVSEAALRRAQAELARLGL